jgi:hypothetical protein
LEMLPMVMPTIPTILGIFGAEAPPLVAALEPTLQAAADINALKALYDAERPFVAFGKIDVRYGPMWKRAEEWPAQVRHTLPAPFGVNRIYGPSAQGPEGRICHSLRMFHRVRRTVRGAGRMCLVHILLALSVHLFNPYQPKLILTRPAWRVFAMQLLGIQLLLNAGADASRSPSLLSALAAAEVHPGGGFHAGAGWVWAGLHGRHALRFPQQVDAAPYHHTPGSVLVQRQFHTARTQVAQAMEANIALARKRFDYVHFDAAASDKLDQRVEKWEKQCDVTVRKLHQLEQMVLLTHQFRARRQCLADHYARRAQVPPLSPASTTTLTWAFEGGEKPKGARYEQPVVDALGDEHAATAPSHHLTHYPPHIISDICLSWATQEVEEVERRWAEARGVAAAALRDERIVQRRQLLQQCAGERFQRRGDTEVAAAARAVEVEAAADQARARYDHHPLGSTHRLYWGAAKRLRRDASPRKG